MSAFSPVITSGDIVYFPAIGNISRPAFAIVFLKFFFGENPHIIPCRLAAGEDQHLHHAKSVLLPQSASGTSRSMTRDIIAPATRPSMASGNLWLMSLVVKTTPAPLGSDSHVKQLAASVCKTGCRPSQDEALFVTCYRDCTGRPQSSFGLPVRFIAQLLQKFRDKRRSLSAP
jgi:hypothetical protein